MPTLDARKLADVAAVIKAVREDKGISQAELAERLAFSRDYMVDLESGKPNICRRHDHVRPAVHPGAAAASARHHDHPALIVLGVGVNPSRA